MTKSRTSKKLTYDPAWIDDILPDTLVTSRHDASRTTTKPGKKTQVGIPRTMQSPSVPALASDEKDRYDLWGIGKDSLSNISLGRTPSTAPSVKGYSTRREREIKQPRNVPLTPDKVQPVALPHSGQSINPSSEAYSEALQIATDKLLRRQRAMDKATFADKNEPNAKTPRSNEPEVADADSDGEGADHQPTLGGKPRPKTEKQRRRQREHQARESLVLEKKKRRKRESDVEHWEELRAEVLQEKAERHARYVAKKRKLRIGSHKYVVRALDVHPNPSARLNANGHEYITHPMEERLQSYQVRGLIPPVANARRNKKYRTIARYRWTFRKDST